MQKLISVTCIFLLSTSVSYYGVCQPGKYFTASNSKCKNFKVFIDHRIQQYCGNSFIVDWNGDCANGFASGNGKLQIVLMSGGERVVMIYKGKLSAGKKEGNGRLVVFTPLDDNTPISDQESFVSMLTRYEYTGLFKNDEFDGLGEFKATYSYPYSGNDEHTIIMNRRFRFFMSLWRSDLFFYEYKGPFKNGKIADTEYGDGVTRRTKPFGGRYKGAIKNGMPNGAGGIVEAFFTPRPNDEASPAVSGNFVNGILNGYGKETGGYFEYEGEFVNGVRQGKGKLTNYKWASDKPSYNPAHYSKQVSSIIEGDFKNGNANGFCTIYYQNSAAYKYTGPMKNGYLEGTGEIEYLDGSKFRGNFRNGVREGRGAVQFTDGDKFSGEYSNDKPVSGTMYYSNGSKYEGGFTSVEEFKSDGRKVNMYKRHGYGTITEKEGRKYNVNCLYGNCTETN